MGDLRNEFSWSFSRHSTLAECPRRYWYRHHGHWGGWDVDAPAETREIYRLTKLEDRATWAGKVVHGAIARALRRSREGRPIEDVDGYLRSVRDTMRREFADSRDDVARRTGRYKWHVRFFEHEEGLDDGSPAWKERWRSTWETVDTGLRNFLASPLHARLAALPAADWIEIEDPDAPVGPSFVLDGVRVHVKVDCAYREGPLSVVVDWKTGRGGSELTPVQLAAYALYLAARHEIDPRRLRAREVHVVSGQVTEHDVGPEALEIFRDVFAASVARMRSLLADVPGNVAKPAAEFPFTDDDRSCRFCHFRSLCPKVSPAF